VVVSINGRGFRVLSLNLSAVSERLQRKKNVPKNFSREPAARRPRLISGAASSQLGASAQLNLRRSRLVRAHVVVVVVVPARLLRPVTRIQALKAHVDMSDTEPVGAGVMAVG
jgi:hypothetical protein